MRNVKPLARTQGIGFTLIELLVVVSIISLLIALLMPALRHARKTANTVRCASNLRQAHLAQIMYCRDQRDSAFAWTSRFSTGWNIRISKYIDGKPFIVSNPDATGAANATFFTNFPSLDCPENRALGGLYYHRRYGFNAVMTAGSTTGTSVAALALAWSQRRTLDTLRLNHSQIILTSDLRLVNFLNWGNEGFISNLNSSEARVHYENKMNMQFVDGHVQLIGRGQAGRIALNEQSGTNNQPSWGTSF